MKHLLLRVGLVVIWILAWGDVSLANLLSGIVVSSGLLLVFPIDDSADAAAMRFRPWPVAVLVAGFAYQLVRSNIQVAASVVRRRPRLATGVVGCPLRSGSETMQTIVANLLALSPGTMPLELRSTEGIIFVHVLQLADPEEVRRTVTALEGRVVQAFGSAEEVARLREPLPHARGWTAP